MIVYGKSGVSFAKELYYDPSGTDPNKFSDWEKAKREGFKLVDHFLGTFTGLNNWLKRTKQFARKTGYVETMFGRRRRLPDLKSSVSRLKAEAERQAINAPIQGTGSDLTLLSLVHINNWLKQNNMKSLIIATVHDSIVFDVYLPEMPILAPQIKKIMESVHQPYINTRIPILIDLELGKDYGSSYEVDVDSCLDIYDETSFKEWVKQKNLSTYKKEVDYLKNKLNYDATEIFRYLLSHNRMNKNNPKVYNALYQYVEKVFTEE